MFDSSIIKRGFHMSLHFVKNHASEIEAIAGGLFIGAGMISIIKNADEISSVNAEVRNDRLAKEEIELSGSWEEQGETKNHYIMRTTKNHTIGYIKSTWKGVGLTAIGIGLFALSNTTLHRQIEAISASLAATTMSYNQYRQRVIDDMGEEKDYQYYTGGVMKTVEMKDDGTVIETTTPIAVEDDRVYIPHSFFFDASNSNYTDNAFKNRTFLEQCLYFINKRLEIDGFMTENDMREVLGAPKTIAGQASGAFYKNPDGTINTISFGIEDNTLAAQAFRDGTNPDFLVILRYSDGRPICNNVYPELEKLGFWSRI